MESFIPKTLVGIGGSNVASMIQLASKFNEKSSLFSAMAFYDQS